MIAVGKKCEDAKWMRVSKRRSGVLIASRGVIIWWDDGFRGVPNYCSHPRKKMIVRSLRQDSGDRSQYVDNRQARASPARPAWMRQSPGPAAINITTYLISRPNLPLHSLPPQLPFLLDVLTTFLASTVNAFLHHPYSQGRHCPKAPRTNASS